MRFLADESGATSIEYAMIAAGIAAVLVAAIQGLGTSVHTLFVSVDTALR
jgi:pilus assembly protein Flp/PilA